MSPLDPHQLAREGEDLYRNQDYTEAARRFDQARQLFQEQDDELKAAEMANNRSVALLKANLPEQAWQAAAGTDSVFQAHGDRTRQATALLNQAAALEALRKFDSALELYQRAADLLEQSGPNDLYALTLKSIASIYLKQGKWYESAIQMLSWLGALERPTLFQRVLRLLLRIR